MDRRRKIAGRRLRWPAAVWAGMLLLGGITVLAGCIYVLPRVLVPDRSAASLAAVADAARRLELEDARLSERNDVRTTLLQGLAGAVVAVGLSLTWRQIRVNQEGQITERFNQAIDHLGSDKLDLRLGGIYALERIAKNSDDDRGTIAEVLTAFVRQRSPWPPSQPGQYRGEFDIHQQPDLRTRAADIEAVLTVLGRGGFTRHGAPQLDLAEVDLRRANLSGAYLDHANLRGAHLAHADLVGTHLEQASLVGANLDHANLSGVHLAHADLSGAHVEQASLVGANLERAMLIDANLERANLARAHLERAYLSGAHLSQAVLITAHLEQADLTGAHLERADLTGAHLTGAFLREADLGSANLARAHVERADLRRSYLGGANLSRASIQGVHLDGAVADAHTSWPDDSEAAPEGVEIHDVRGQAPDGEVARAAGLERGRPAAAPGPAEHGDGRPAEE